MGIEPTMPLLSQSIIGFEDRGRHQSGTHFRRGSYPETTTRARKHRADFVRADALVHVLDGDTFCRR
jgi:hypothetical protein